MESLLLWHCLPGNQEGMGVVTLQAVANCAAHPLLEGREGRESMGKRGKDRVRRDFWEPSEGWGSHSSLKREEEDRSEATPDESQAPDKLQGDRK